MVILISITDKTTMKKVHLTDGMITSMKRNHDDSANIELGKEKVVFDSIEPHDWILSNYGKLN